MTDNLEEMGKIIIRNCELWWARVVTPDGKFDKDNPNYSVQIRTEDKNQMRGWKELGLKVTAEVPDDDDLPPYWKTTLYQKKFNSKGKENKAPKVMNTKREELDGNLLGNGSIGHLRVFWYIGQDGKRKYQLLGIQVTKFIKYEPVERDDVDFEELPEDTEWEEWGDNEAEDDDIPFDTDSDVTTL